MVIKYPKIINFNKHDEDLSIDLFNVGTLIFTSMYINNDLLVLHVRYSVQQCRKLTYFLLKHSGKLMFLTVTMKVNFDKLSLIIVNCSTFVSFYATHGNINRNVFFSILHRDFVDNGYMQRCVCSSYFENSAVGMTRNDYKVGLIGYIRNQRRSQKTHKILIFRSFFFFSFSLSFLLSFFPSSKEQLRAHMLPVLRFASKYAGTHQRYQSASLFSVTWRQRFRSDKERIVIIFTRRRSLLYGRIIRNALDDKMI